MPEARVALITAGGSGMGAAAARRLAADGYRVGVLSPSGKGEALAKELPKEQAEEVAEDMKVLAEQATKEKPNPKWYNVSIDGLIAAAQNLGKVGEVVIDLSGKVRKILTGGLL